METPAIQQLYKQYIDAWNSQDAHTMASLTTNDCIMVGFDGSQMFGKADIESSISQIFANHKTARYVTIVKRVTFLTDEVAVLNSVVGMVPPGAEDIKPDKNAIQLLTAKRDSDNWLIAAFQNTPAAFDGRPELGEQLTMELRGELVKTSGTSQS
ncbi:MAG: SgcJ/EcaC family oxidoreductase [Bacteroidota bacterium]